MNTTITQLASRTPNLPTTAIVDGRRDPSRLRRTLGVGSDPQSYRNIAYLLLGLPMGILWFSLLVSVVSIGISTLFIALLGIPALIGCWYLTRTIANIERVTANTLLSQQLSPARFDAPTGNLWSRLRAMSTDRARWRELGFVLLRFPVGVATFTAAVGLLTTSATVAYAPFYVRYSDDHSFGDWTLSSRLEDITSSPWAWLLVPLGTLSLIASLHLMSKLAEACGRWTSAWLGPVENSAATTATVQPARASEGFARSALLRIHALTFAAVMAVLALIDVAEGGATWIQWPLITWGAALGLHTALARTRSQRMRSPRHPILRTHETVFASTITMLLLVDVADGDGIWFHRPLAIWGTLLLIHEAAVRRYGSIAAT